MLMLAAESGDWLRAHFSTPLTWRHLWDLLKVRDFMLLNEDGTEVLGISEEEHEYLALRFTAS